MRAFNGVASTLVTEDGLPIAQATGTSAPRRRFAFPPKPSRPPPSCPISTSTTGPPLEFGRMEPTASDPDVKQQFGMIVGIPNAGQVNALATLNIRGERSVTCRGDFDRHPSEGPLPPGAPPVCELFRQLPDALERAAELDAAYGRNPDLAKMPMYGVVFSFKDPFDTKDMRSTGGGDAGYDIDFPARDHVLVEQLRNKGAIIFAKAVNTEYNGRAGDPGGRHRPEKVLPSTLGYQRSTWGGNPSNPYDTTRSASLGSSSGSAVSVSTNMVMASLGEETRASCRGPSNHNAVALILPHKSMLGFDGGAIGADIYCDRSGIHCRTIGDCAKVLDALKDPIEGYYDPRDPYTTVPRVVGAEHSLCKPCQREWRTRRAQGHAPRRHSRVHGDPARLQDRRADRHRGCEGNQTHPRCAARHDAGGIHRSAVEERPGPGTHDDGFPPRAGASGAGVHARPVVPAGTRRTTRLQGLRGGDRADRVHAGKIVWLPEP